MYSLLKVEPSERLTVEEVLAYPWLTKAPDTHLVSPNMMLDSVSGIYVISNNYKLILIYPY